MYFEVLFWLNHRKGGVDDYYSWTLTKYFVISRHPFLYTVSRLLVPKTCWGAVNYATLHSYISIIHTSTHSTCKLKQFKFLLWLLQLCCFTRHFAGVWKIRSESLTLKMVSTHNFEYKCDYLVLLTVVDVIQVQWDAFLQGLDDELQMSAQILDGNNHLKYISSEISLINARTGE